MKNDNNPILEFTGERFTPECVREIWYEHWHRYHFASKFIADKTVLDIACGEGYGSCRLAESAAYVTGMDVDTKAIEHAKQKYKKENLSYQQASVLDIPLPEGSVDVIVSFETLEHLAQHEQIFSEFRRVLKKEGILLVSTPDKYQYSDLTGYNNPDHVKELYLEEFQQLINGHFEYSELFAQKLMFCSAIWNEDHRINGGYCLHHHGETTRTSSRISFPPIYHIAVCSQYQIPKEQMHALDIMTDEGEMVYKHYDEVIKELIDCGKQLNDRNEQIRLLKQQIRQLESCSR